MSSPHHGQCRRRILVFPQEITTCDDSHSLPAAYFTTVTSGVTRGGKSVWLMAGPQERMADSRTSESGGSSFVSREASLVERTVLAEGKRKRGYAADFLTRTSARCPVAAKTRMNTSVDTP